MLATYGIDTQTPKQVEPIQIWPPSELIKVGWVDCNADFVLSRDFRSKNTQSVRQ